MAAAVACGASGRASAGWAGVDAAVGVVDCCAATGTATNADRAETRSACVNFMPCLRVNHAAGVLPEAGFEHVLYPHDVSPDSACFPAHGSGRVHDFLPWNFNLKGP